MVIQVNGKLRGEFTVPVGTPEEELKRRALEHDKVQKYLEGKIIRKVIVAKGVLVSIVVSEA